MHQPLNDRRVERTKEQLKQALGSLMLEKPFDKITVHEIIERANVGRTTFYAHYQSKEDLFLSEHDPIIEMFVHTLFDADGTIRPAPMPEFIAFLERIDQNRDAFFFLARSAATSELRRLLKDRVADRLVDRLRLLVREQDSAIPFEVLTQHVAISVVSLVNWWTAKRTPYTAAEFAAMLHQMNVAALRAAIEF